MNINELFSVEGKVAVVTGGSKGIGKMIATGLAMNGAKVYITARHGSTLQKTQAELLENYNADVYAIPCDLSKLGMANSPATMAVTLLYCSSRAFSFGRLVTQRFSKPRLTKVWCSG